jgi:hypothetical protein
MLAIVAAALVATTPAAHAYPLVCVDVVNGKGVHTTACTPFAQMFGRECFTVDPGYYVRPYVSQAVVCVATPVGTPPR